MTTGRIVAARLLFLAAWGLACIVAAPGALGGDSGYAMPSRAKVAALLTGLFHYHADPSSSIDSHPEFTSPVFASSAPGEFGIARVRGDVIAFADSLVYEGGFYPQEIYALMGYESVAAARIARKVRQLDIAMGRASPWEIAGRVGRSGAVDTSDVWTMAGPLGEGEAAGSGSGVLSLLPVLSVAYACYPEDGLNAAARLSLLRDDDLRAEAVGRAAFSLIRRVLMAGGFDKDGWLRGAAGDAGDLDSERELRSVRVKDWRYLRGEECAMGRMERVVYLWYRGDCYERIMREGVKFLRSRESLDYLAALTAATYGRDGMPPDVVQAGAGDRKVMELVNDLHDLATSEAVLRVAPEEDDEEDL